MKLDSNRTRGLLTINQLVEEQKSSRKSQGHRINF